MQKIKLDPDQQRAVKHFEGPALVVAGPGSGKTTVIKERILNLIWNHNVDPERILAIAFTNAAADEMTDRLSNEPLLNHSKPKICTLHAFGKDLITDNPKQAGFKEAPHNIWAADDIGKIIKDEKYRLQRTTRAARVAIYKFEGMTTGRCYIGQTIDPERREQEHRTYSSNRGLREALQKGDEKFEFKVIATAIGQNADDKESLEIRLHKNRAAVNLDQNTKKTENARRHIPVFIYKIKSLTTVTCWIGQSEKPEQSIEDHYNNSSDDDFRNAIENGNFEIITEKLSKDKANRRVLQEIEKHENWAVFNCQDPLQARDSNRRRIEIFCKYFNVGYDEVIEHTQKFRDLMKRFDTMKDDIEKVKRRVETGLFKPNDITDSVLRAFAERYEERKAEAKAIDFLHMLIFSANMLEEHPKLLHEYREKYHYVFVDEFQDISPIDFRLIDLFSENLFAVGDDDQAIYGFRGGDSSIMREKFGKRRNVTHYEITRNYRSTSTIVRHAKALIEHNPERIPKNLRAKNSAQNRVKIFETPQKTETLKEVLLRELSNLLTTDLKKVGILARNWKGEINNIQDILDFSELQIQGFEIDWEELGDPSEKNRRKIILRRGTKEIEILNIHTAKGREWEKVILLVNTMYNSLPDDRNDLAEERRLFYVAVTRAKQELVVLNGGNCQFIPEFQNAPPIEIVKAEQTRVTPEPPKWIETSTKIPYKPPYTQHKPHPLRRDASEVKNTTPPSQISPPKQLINTHRTVTKERGIWSPDHLDEVVTIYLDRIIFRCGNMLNLGNIDKPYIKRKMVQYLSDLDIKSAKEIVSFSAKSIETIGDGRFADYCIGPEKTHLCTEVFRDFWNRMWEVVEQSRKVPESFGKPPQPFIDKPIPILEIEIESPEQPPKLRNIQPMNKAVEPIPEANESPLIPKAKPIPLDKSINVIIPEPTEKIIDTPPPMSTDITESLDTYVKNLRPETYLKPETSEPKNPDNVTQQPTSETGVDGEIPIESTTLTRSDSSAEIDSDTPQIKVQNSSENEVENGKKSFGDYLSQDGRFVVEKIKVIIFTKPSS